MLHMVWVLMDVQHGKQSVLPEGLIVAYAAIMGMTHHSITGWCSDHCMPLHADDVAHAPK